MKKQINSLITKGMWCAIILFVIRCLISFEEIKHGISAYLIWGFAGEAIGASALVMVVYEKWLWKFDPFVKTPKICGSYSGTIDSSFDSQQRKAFLTIKQTLLSVDIKLKTDESTSRAVSASIEEVFGENELVYTYLNEPKSKVRDRSEIHFGTATFVLDGSDHLVGKYYTDRKTVGDLDFHKESTKHSGVTENGAV